MKNRRVRKLNLEKKLLLAVVGMLVAWSPLMVGSAKAQSSPRPAFEVASLKQTTDGEGPIIIQFFPRRAGGRLTWDTFFDQYLKYAYHLPSWRISGVDISMPFRYTLEATMDPSTSEDQVRLMMQTLLTDRFKIVSHLEARSCSGYRLVVEKNGSKLKTATAAGEALQCPSIIKVRIQQALKAESLQRDGALAYLGSWAVVFLCRNWQTRSPRSLENVLWIRPD